MEMFGAPLPRVEELSAPVYRDYVAFKRITSEELSARIAGYIHQHDGLALVNYQVKFADIVRSESNSGVDRPLPMWQFSGSDNVKRVHGSSDAKPSCNAAVYFADIPYRLAAVSPHLTSLRLAQDLSHGGDIDLYVLGTLQQPDRQALPAARRIYDHAARHSDAYRGLQSMASTCLLYPERAYAYGLSTRAAYRGAFRLLTEQQILFDCMHDFALDGEGTRASLARYDLLVLPGVACLSDRQIAVLDAFVERGGRLLATGRTALYDEMGRARGAFGLACLGAARVCAERAAMRSAYWRVHERPEVPFQSDTDLIFLDGLLLYVEPRPGSVSTLSLVPPFTFGPPEKVSIDQTEVDAPGLLWHTYGAGKTAFLPWEVDALYYRHSSPGHSAVLCSVLHALRPEQQVLANGGSQLEVSLHSQGDGTYVLGLVNVSGHHGTAFFAPVPMHDLELKLALPRIPTSARSLTQDVALALWREHGRTCLRLDRLDLFDTIQLT
jgi:hypothetical protein